MMRRRRWASLAVACCLVVATAGPSRAAAPAETEAQATARAHFRRAESDYAAGRYAEALAEYQAGYDAAPLPGFLVNIAQCHRRLGDLARARATYSRFIMVAPDSPLVPEVRNLVAELDRLLEQAQAAETAPPAAGPDDVVAPGTQGAPAAPGPSGAVGGGAAKPTAVALAAPQPKPEEATRAELVGAPAPSETEPAEGSRRKWWLWGGIAAAVLAGAVVAVVLSSRDPETIHDGSLGTLRR